MGRLYLALLLLAIAVGCSTKGKTKEENTSSNKTEDFKKDKYQYLDTLVPQLLTKYKVPSITVSIIEDASIAWSGVFGEQSPATHANENTLYLCASITKPLTAEVFLRLTEQGKASLDEPMYRYYVDPDIKDDPRAKLLTPRHVLTHTTGFKNWRRMTQGVLRFVNDPGVEMGYSGEGFQYLVRFIEQKFDKPFNAIANEVLFTPLEMHHSSLVEQDWYKGRLAWPKFPDGTWAEPFVRKEALGAGGLHTNSVDYAKFLVGIMKNKGLSETMRKEQFRITMNQYEHCLGAVTKKETCPKSLGFGLGWYVYDFENGRVIGHTGANLGERTLAVFSLEKKSGFVAMTNGANGNYVIYDIAREVGVNNAFIEIEKPKKPYHSEQK